MSDPFSYPAPPQHVPDEEIEGFLADLASEVHKRKLSVMAIFLLELHKPVASFFYSGALLSLPLLTPLFGAKNLHRVTAILRKREHIERLIQAIEGQEASISPPRENRDSAL